MKLLVFGGTLFVGRHMVEAALRAGHEVTIFNRGKTNPDLFPEVEKLKGDRDGGLAPLEDRRWDAVIDVNGYVPRIVRESAELLKDSVDHYIFISTGAVYQKPALAGYNEDSPVETVEDETTEDVRGHYGALKALCEQQVEHVFPGRTLVMRLGLVCGPHDDSDRTTYWITRVAQGGEMLAPGVPDQPIQVVDARDLTDFAMLALEKKFTGIYNCTGQTLTWQQWFDTFKQVSGGDPTYTWINDREFLKNELPNPTRRYGAFPLFMPESMGDWWTANSDRAQAIGLNYRPMAETAQAILDWDKTRPADEERMCGLTPEEEQMLLRKWHAKT